MDTRQQAIDAAAHVIAQHGVLGATFRKIAAQAQLSPGTLTYHFPTLDDLLLATFTQFRDSVSARFAALLAAAPSPQQACEAVADLLGGGLWSSPEQPLLAFELYAMAARQPAYQAVLHQWMELSQAALRQHFAPDTARVMDALIEGLTNHNLLGAHPLPRATMLAHLQAIAGLPAP